MRHAARPLATSVVALVVASAGWAALQAVLAAAHGRQSAAAEARGIALFNALAEARGRAPLGDDLTPLAETGASYWGPLVASGTLQLLALSALALVLVHYGRRRSWAVLALLGWLRPALTEPAQSTLHSLGYGWTGPWVHAGVSDYGRSAVPGISTSSLGLVGGAVDLLVVAVPALLYLWLTRHGRGAAALLDAGQVLRRVAWPVVAVVVLAVALAMVDLETDADALRAIAIVPVTAALLAATGLGAARSAGAVFVAMTLASPAADMLAYAAQDGGGSTLVVPAVADYAIPIAVLAAVGAAAAVHGPALAATYRRLVGRPEPSVTPAG